MMQDGLAELPLPYLDPTQRGFAISREGDIFAAQTMSARDGVPLTVLSAGQPSQPTVLLVNALGVSYLFLARLARVLASDYRVVTWESRGLPDDRAVPDDADFSLTQHAKDAADILAWMGQGRLAAVVSFCSGVNVAVHALSGGVLAADRLCIISPSIELAAALERTDYQQTMLPLWRKVATSGLRMAGLVRVLLEQPLPTDSDGTARELQVLNALPFRSAESTYRYARMQTACLELDGATVLPRLGLPVLVLHGEQDDLIHTATPQAVAAAIPGAVFRSVAGAGHFAVHSSAILHTHVLDFLRGDFPTSSTGDADVYNRYA